MKILFVLQCSWGANIGIAKVHYDLKPEFEKLGHTVDVLSYDDFNASGQSKLSKLFRTQIDKQILKKLKNIAKNYDVIDANYHCIPYPKALFNFEGLLVFRSHGIPAVYRIQENSKEYNFMLSKIPKKPIKFKTRVGNIYRYFSNKLKSKKTLYSILNADLVHCLNQAEVDYVKSINIPEEKIVLIPNGIADNYIDSAYLENENIRNEISFLASWTPRKGIYDFNDIFSQLKNITNHKINLKVIGTFFNENYVKENLDLSFYDNFSVIQSFTSDQLPYILNNTKVGVFPSYIEGFGLAVVEQLAAGIPVVSYDIPGPRGILDGLDENLLVPVGNTVAMSNSINYILSMDENEYKELQKKCIVRAKEYKVSEIAKTFINEYEKGLYKVRGKNN